MLYETVVLMDKMDCAPKEKIAILGEYSITGDDVFCELAKAYNQAMMPESAIETLQSQEFVPCEGGEHAIAEEMRPRQERRWKKVYA